MGIMHTGPLLSGGASQHVPGAPTMSQPLDPGPYHKANALFRAQFPHFHVDVTVNTHWDHILLCVLAILIYVVYLSVRMYYLVSGRTASFGAQNTNVVYSYVVLVAETALGLLGFYGNLSFWEQEVQFSAMDTDTLKHISQDVAMHGVRQTVHVLVTTYTEPAYTVRECVIRCLVAPEPVYMEKHIYVCDDGHAKSEGPKKRAMVEELRVLGVYLFLPPVSVACCSHVLNSLACTEVDTLAVVVACRLTLHEVTCSSYSATLCISDFYF
jgi:hypothetical protein